jgi:chromosomal replication initiator protein
MERLYTDEVAPLASEQGWAAELGQAIARRIGERSYDLWFNGRTRFTWKDECLIVGTPNRHLQEWLQKKFGETVAAAAGEVTSQTWPVRFVIDPELFRAARQAEAAAQAAPAPHPSAPADDVPSGKNKLPKEAATPSVNPAPPSTAARKTLHQRRWHSLQDFVVGPCNRVAHASALAVAANPGLDVNPLVLHGPVGTGKTHLLEGIYLELRKQHPDWRICFVTAEDFTNRFVQALRTSKLSAFRKHFRDCDALLLDDLHFLAKARASQEEYLHTFDALHADGRQIVVTCDCHPRLNDKFAPELVDRLLGGAAWGLVPPDFDTRLNLLRAKSRRDNAPAVVDEVLEFLAEQLRGNVRELEGAVHSILHFSRVTGRKIDVALTREVLGDLLRHTVRVVRLAEVDQAVCSILHMAQGALQGKERSWAYSHPRMLAMYLARKHTAATYTEIGRHFGNRSHSTVVAAEKKVRLWLQDDESLALGGKQLRVRDLVERAERDLLG